MAALRLAKLSLPRVSGALTRPRLHRLLDEAIQCAAVWIAAEPGAGKSTLAATWASSRPGSVLWYRVDEGDADPAAAFGYFRELARSTRRTRVLPAFTARDLDRLDHFARSFFRAFFACVPAASTLVIDDVHAVREGVFGVLLAAVVREAPRDVGLVILSRQDPSGWLLEAVTTGALEVLDGVALTFTRDEAAGLLAPGMDETRAHRLHAESGGWAAGLTLLAQAPLGGDERRAEARERIASFFGDRVLAPFDRDELRTLTAVALLAEVDLSGLRAMGLDERAADLLERLRKRHAFVTRLDRQVPTWRLHDLLRDALRGRLDALGDDDWRRRLAISAAGVAFDRGLAREAVELHVLAGDTATARVAAESRARALIRAQRPAELDAIAAALGPAIVENSVPMQIALGESASQRNDARAAVSHFERAFQLVDEPAPSATRLLVAASALGAILEGWQDYGGAEQWAGELRAHLDARTSIDDPGDAMRIDSACVRGMSIIWGERLGDYRALVGRILDALRRPHPRLAPDEAIAASGVLIEAAGYRLADESLFHDTVEATAAWLPRTDLAPVVKAGWLNTYAPLGRHWPSLGVRLPAEGPAACLELAVQIARDHGAQSTAFTAAWSLLSIATGENDRATAQRRLAVLREIADSTHVRQTCSLLDAEAAVLALAGEWPRARVAIDRALELSRQHAFPASEQWALIITQRRIEIASGSAATAREALLRDSATFPEGMRRDFALILADVAAAAQDWRECGTIPAARVEQVMHRARDYSWRGFGILLAPIAARLCADALRLGIEPEFARRVVRERHLPAPVAWDPHWPWSVRVHALGGLRIAIDDEPLVWGPRAQRRALDLLKAVIAHGPAPVDAAVVLDALWPDADGAAARASFDMAVMRLRKLLRHDDALRLDAGHIGIDPGCVWVDAFAFADGTIDDYPGPLFGADAVAPWWAPARERLHQRFLRRTVERGVALEQAGQFDAALAVFEAGLAQDSLAEGLYQGVIRCHLAAGRAADALRAFRRCRDQLSIVLAVTPSAATSALVAGLSAR